MNTRSVVACVALAAAVSAGPVFGQTVGATARSSVVYLEGQVAIDGRPAAIGDTVPLGATIATAAQSLCEIEFNAKNVVRLGEDTTLVFNPGNLQQGSELKKGTLALVLRNISTVASAARFTVRTPSAVAGVRGTTFFINALDANTTYVCSCNGSVHVEDLAGGSAHDMVSAHHKAYLFTSSASGVNVADSTLLYHSDADMEKLAADIGVNIDWTVPDRAPAAGR
jgi:hypothetical protein